MDEKFNAEASILLPHSEQIPFPPEVSHQIKGSMNQNPSTKAQPSHQEVHNSSQSLDHNTGDKMPVQSNPNSSPEWRESDGQLPVQNPSVAVGVELTVLVLEKDDVRLAVVVA